MRMLKSATVAVGLVAFALVPAYAGQRGNSGNHGPTTHGAPGHPAAQSNAGPKSGSTTHGNSGSAHTPHTPDAASAADNESGHSPKNTKTTTSTTNATNTSTSTFTSTPVGQKLTKNTALQSKLSTELQGLGYPGTVFEAAYGFKNLGQFVAAVNVSRNLGIPFDQLKLQMTGMSVDAAGHVTQSNTPTKSLGQAIQTLKPGVDADASAQKATEEAETETETENTSKTTTTTTTATTRATRKKSS